MLRPFVIFIFALFELSPYSQCIIKIHYDNSDGDLNEEFEIAGLARIDLSYYDVISKMETRIKIKSIQLY